MAAISMPIAARAEYALHQLAKREKNWAQREPGVIVVFVIVFLVAVLVIAMFINKKVRRSNLPNRPILSPYSLLTPTTEASRQRPRIRYPFDSKLEQSRAVRFEGGQDMTPDTKVIEAVMWTGQRACV